MGRRNKMWNIVPFSEKKFDQIRMDDKVVQLNAHGGANVHDPGLAKAINQKFGVSKTGTGDVLVTETDSIRDAVTDPGHKYFFAPSQEYSRNWEDVFGREKKVNKLDKCGIIGMIKGFLCHLSAENQRKQ